MAIEWYYACGSERLGPCSIEQLRGLASTGSLNPSDLVWNESMSNWEQAGTIAGLFADAQTARGPRKPRPTTSGWEVDDLDGPPTEPSPNPGHDFDPSGVTEWAFGLLDFKFRRSYTVLLVHFLWIGYLVLTALALILCLLAVFIPNTVFGLIADLTTSFYDPSEPTTGSGSRFSGRLGAFLGLVLFLGFVGMSLRVFLETLSVQFRIIEALRELGQPHAGSRRDRTTG